MIFPTWFKFIPYVVILLLVCLALWLWRGKDNAQSERDTNAVQVHSLSDKNKELTDIHKQDVATIDRVTAYRVVNDRVVTDFVDNLKTINGRFDDLNDSLQNLRRTNAEVENFLTRPIPVPLARVLNGLCNSASAGSRCSAHR